MGTCVSSPEHNDRGAGGEPGGDRDVLLTVLTRVFSPARVNILGGKVVVEGEIHALSSVLLGPEAYALIDSTDWICLYSTNTFPCKIGDQVWSKFTPRDGEEASVVAATADRAYAMEWRTVKRDELYSVQSRLLTGSTIVVEVVSVTRRAKTGGAGLGTHHGPWPFRDLVQKDFLGKGGYGTVLLAVNPAGESFAVKVCTLYSPPAQTVHTVKNLEAVLSSSFEHPNVLGTLRHENVRHSVNMVDIWMVLPFCESGSLDDLLKAGHFRSLDAVHLAATQISAGMQYLHARDVIHGDLSPANVLFTRDHTAKISDFGLSRFDATATIHTATHGAPLYTAPELQTSGQLRKAVDVYSFGLLLWEMCHCTRVFGGGADAFVIKAQNPQPVLSGAHTQYAPLIAACTGGHELRPTFSAIALQLGELWKGKSPAC